MKNLTLTFLALLFVLYSSCTVAQNFVTQWDLANSGSGATQLSFGVATSGTVNYTWETVPSASSGSGTFSGSTATITGLPANTVIRLKISPTNFQRISMDYSTDRNRLILVENWGSTQWTSMEYAFYGCANLQVSATNVPNLNSVTNMSYMFAFCTNLNSPANIGSWNTANVTNMSYMFYTARTFNQPIGSWNTANVTNMSSMFNWASAFNQPIASWNTANVTDMSSMFYFATAFNQPIGLWSTSNVADMSSMFSRAPAFNQPIGAWNTAKVINMSEMFAGQRGYQSPFNQPIGSWNTASVTDMSGMFSSAYAFNQPIGSWNTASVTDMSGMFSSAYAFNQPIGSWNTANVINMSDMFSYAETFNQPIGSWNTAKVTDMSRMFYAITSVDDFRSAFNQPIGFWNTANVTNMSGMFGGALVFNQPIASWNTTNVTDMSSMFNDARDFNQPIASWNTANVTNMSNMFSSFNTISAFNKAIDSWNTAKVTNMSGMFKSAEVFNQPIGSWNTSNVTDMEAMFWLSPAFNQPIGSWNTAKVTKMRLMFNRASAFNQPIGMWNTANVTNMEGMFTDAFAFNQAIGSWNLSKVINLNSMLNDSGMDCFNYAATLMGWNASSNTPNNMILGAAQLPYGSQASAARANLVLPVASGGKGWTITDDGLSRGSCGMTAVQDFITRWDLTTSGSGATQLSFGVATSGTVNYTWETIPAASSGSGTFSGSTATITGLPANAVIRLRISPANFQRIIINEGEDSYRLTRVENWGSTAWTSMQNAFSGCIYLRVIATDAPDLAGVTDLSYMFYYCSIRQPANLNSWNTANITNMSGMFSGADYFNQPIGSWNTANVTDMSDMFRGTDFNQPIGSWNTAKVTDMSGMFRGASAFNQPIGSWNTANVTDMSSMFSGARIFNQPIASWNITKVTNMSSMFKSAWTFNQPIGSWNTANVTDMSSMFSNVEYFNQPINSWNTANVTDMSSMFSGAVYFNQSVGSWNTSNVTNMAYMFYLALTFNQPIGSWNTSNVTDMSLMFDEASAFNQPIGSWNTANVTSMYSMFYGASAFNQSIGSWNIATVYDMNYMLDNSGMDCSNYSATLIGWNANTNTPNGLSLGASGRQYGSQASAARANLVTLVASGGKGWTITDGGLSSGYCGTVATTISTPTFSGAEFCAGTNVSVSFSTTGTFAGGNQFNVLLSDANANFSSPKIIGTATSAGSVICTIPANTIGGENYRIKVVSTNPVISGNINNIALKIHPQNWNLVSPANNISSGSTIKKATLTINASNTISGVSIVEYNAAKAVNLNPGFQVVSNIGSSFKVNIGGCN